MDDLTPLMNVATAMPRTGWGTALLGTEAVVMLHIINSTPDSIQVCLAHPMILGRTDQNDDENLVDLSAYAAAALGVSHQHASLEIVNKTLMLTDLSSLNGTCLNQEKMPPNQPRIVRDGDEVQLGQLVIHVYYEMPVTEEDRVLNKPSFG